MAGNKGFYHIGIVVENIDESIKYYVDNMGIHFADPAVTELTISNPTTGKAETVSVKVTYSRKSSPYIELIEAVGDSIFSKKNIGGILYYGLWENNITQRIESLKNNQVDIEALIAPSGQDTNALITAPNINGVRVEYVTDTIQGYVKAWTLTGKVPGQHWLASLLTGVFSLYYFFRNKLFS